MRDELLIDGAKAMGISLPNSAAEAFIQYYRFLEEQNKVMNLTAIGGWEDTVRLHFLDSLALLTFTDLRSEKIIDIGSGAGFPGVPLKLAEPGISLTLLDAQQKKVEFMSALCKELSLPDVTCIQARAEEQAQKVGWRDSFDYALSRAVAKLNILCELCMPYVKTGGAFIAMKSVGAEEETTEAKSAIKILGGTIERTVDYAIPGTDIVHRAIIIRKTAPTPPAYPRRFAKIQKQPL